MKRIFTFVRIFNVLFFSFLFVTSSSSLSDREKILIQAIVEVTKEHYSRAEMDEKFSEKAFNLFIKSIDYNKRFLLSSDVKYLNKYKERMAYDFKNGNTEIVNVVRNILYERLEDIKDYCLDILNKPFDLDKEEYLQINPDFRDFSANVQQQRELWRKYLKYETIQQYMELISFESNRYQNKNKFYSELEEKAREKVKKKITLLFERMKNEKEENYFNLYLNSISGAFDPYTSYFPPMDKKDFDINLSGTFEGIGAQLKEEGEYIKVQEIIPGSAAWRQKMLKAGDIILKVGQGNEESVDVVNMPIRDVVKMIRGPKGTEVRLTVKKPDGRIEIISIIRDKVVLEETYAKAFLIKERNSEQKIGYIYLPIFYRDFSNRGGRNASDDIKKALESLKSEGVRGIILDLRNNGGGALEDAIKIAGLFIKDGPVVQVRSGNGDIRPFYDPDPGVVYEGPLVVLINVFSASASEIVAAALQDYGRAVIIGEHTYGKGTVQQFIDLDQFPALSQFRPLGSIKLTVQKFYRITGNSTQLKGVTGDITFPDIYGGMDVGEKAQDYPLSYDSIKSLEYKPWISYFNISVLKEKSALRVKTNEVVNFIISNSAILQSWRNQPKPLDFQSFMKEQSFVQDMNEKLKNFQENLESLDIEFVDGDKEDQLYKDRKERLENFIKQLQKDVCVQEAKNVIMDIIKK